MPHITTPDEAVKLIPDGASIMFGGFMGCGTAHRVVDALVRSGVKNLTVYSNDGGMMDGPLGEDRYGVAKLIHNRQIKTLIATHVGLNPEVAVQSMTEGTLEVILIPQGSFVEMIRAGGTGLGGVLTPTGVGTIIEESPLCLGRQTVQGRDYLLMKPLRADFAVISGRQIDTAGNVWYRGSTSNFSISMAMAADTVIAEAEQIVPPGTIRPEDVRTPGILVDYLVEGGIY